MGMMHRNRLVMLLTCALLVYAAMLVPARLIRAAAAESQTQQDPQVKRGLQLLRERGCIGCHSLDGSRLAGPTLRGLLGSTRQVTTADGIKTITADAEYIRRSLTQPNDEVVVGFSAGSMPPQQLSEPELQSLIAALTKLQNPGPSLSVGMSLPRKREGSTESVIWAAITFCGLHLLLSATPLRRRLVALLSESGFQGGYSLLILFAMGWLTWAYRTTPFVAVWTPPQWTRYVPLLLMPISLFFFVCGFSTKNPAAAGQLQLLGKPDSVRGILRVTRHPGLWGFLLWSGAHLTANGDVASIALFGSIFALALLGMLHIDHRRAQLLGEPWQQFCAQTSRVPFAAILLGRNELRLSEVGLWRPLLTIILYVGILHSHIWLIGVSPYP